jgi:hypothetical protein
MALDALKPLLESGLVNESTRDAINEAWQAKVNEMKTELRTEIREEFAGRYEHDKQVMIKTLDKMVAETLSQEIIKIKEERNAAAKLKLQSIKEMKNAAAKFNNFVVKALAEELAEFSTDRKIAKGHSNKLEQFVMSALAEEITEFSEDKKALNETRVKLVKEGKTQIAELKKNFVAKSASAVSKIVNETLNHEIKQLHEDIKSAHENNFGRQIFEAYSKEFKRSHLNTNATVSSLNNKINRMAKALAESRKTIVEKQKLVESTQKAVRLEKSRSIRTKVLAELLSPLDAVKKNVMGQLLETVQTENLRKAYDKYLPAVLSNREAAQIAPQSRKQLYESTGNKKNNTNNDSLDDIKRLAGL